MANNNKHTGPNVPALRFPEFSGEWECVPLSTYAKKITEKNKGNKIKNVLCNSATRGIVPQSEYFDREIANNENTDGYYVVRNQDFVYNPRKSVSAPYGPVNIYNGEDDGIISPLYLCMKIRGIDKNYLLHYFKSPAWYPYIYQNGDSGVRHDRVSIKDEVFLAMPVSVPNGDEQRKIAKFLDAINERIATQSKIIEEQETLLKSLADSLISSQLANMAINDCVVARSSAMKESELENSGPFPVFGASGLCGYSNEALEESDSILVTKDGSGVGTCQYATGAHAFLGTLCSLTAKEGVYLPYIYYALLNFNFASFKTGLAIPHIYFKDYGKAVIYCPSYDEQVRIASGLEKIEAKIKSDKELLKQYQVQKEYLLSRMFI